jgi:hypothetical protein
MPRPPMPPLLAQYFEWRANGPPQFCHNCIKYADYGTCLKFDMDPPEEFTQQQGICPDWEEDVPF